MDGVKQVTKKLETTMHILHISLLHLTLLILLTEMLQLQQQDLMLHQYGNPNAKWETTTSK